MHDYRLSGEFTTHFRSILR